MSGSQCQVLPAVMASTWDELSRDLSLVVPVVDALQIDVMDGVFVPPLSFPYQMRDGELSVVDIPQLPEAGRVLYEAHLMVQNPRMIAEQFVRAGARRIIFHVETCTTSDEAKLCAAALRSQGVEVGVSLLLDTPLDAIAPIIEQGLVDMVQVMSIAEIGYQGRAFDERGLVRVHILRDRYPELPIAVDGGVNARVLPSLIEAGATRFGVGSAIMQAENPAEAYGALQQRVDDLCA